MDLPERKVNRVKCKVDDCTRLSDVAGLCGMHYKRKWKETNGARRVASTKQAASTQLQMKPGYSFEEAVIIKESKYAKARRSKVIVEPSPAIVVFDLSLPEDELVALLGKALAECNGSRIAARRLLRLDVPTFDEYLALLEGDEE